MDDIVKTLGSVAEGVPTAKGAKMIIDELGINAPIATSVSRVQLSQTMICSWSSDETGL